MSSSAGPAPLEAQGHTHQTELASERVAVMCVSSELRRTSLGLPRRHLRRYSSVLVMVSL